VSEVSLGSFADMRVQAPKAGMNHCPFLGYAAGK
jgi:hypothetical protein